MTTKIQIQCDICKEIISKKCDDEWSWFDEDWDVCSKCYKVYYKILPKLENKYLANFAAKEITKKILKKRAIKQQQPITDDHCDACHREIKEDEETFSGDNCILCEPGSDGDLLCKPCFKVYDKIAYNIKQEWVDKMVKQIVSIIKKQRKKDI